MSEMEGSFIFLSFQLQLSHVINLFTLTSELLTLKFSGSGSHMCNAIDISSPKMPSSLSLNELRVV